MDLSASQAQPSAARAGPRRPTRRVEADHRRRVVRHKRPSPWGQARRDALGSGTRAAPRHNRLAMRRSPRVGCIRLRRRGAPGTGSVRAARPLAQEPQDMLRGRRRRAGLTCLGNPDGAPPLLVQGLTPRGVLEGQIAGSALRPGWRPHGAGQGRCP